MNCTECKELLVAHIEGLLDQSQQQAVAEHLKDCSACKAEAEALRGLQDRLASNGKVLARSDLENDVMNQIVREQKARLKTAEKAAEAVGWGSAPPSGNGGPRPTLQIRRTIMKSRIAKIAAAAVIIIAMLIGINPFKGTITFAQVVEPILNAKTVIFDMVIGSDDSGPVMHEIVAGSRIRRILSNIPNVIQIIDPETGKMLALDTEEKTAVYVDIQGRLREGTRNYVEFLRQVVVKLQDNHEELGEQEIDGQKAIGFVSRGPNEEVKIWADPKTALPIRIELRVGQFFSILKNFQFDVQIEDRLISMDVPEGYTLQETKFDLSGATEQDFIEGLRVWAKVIDGRFPEAIGTENTMKQVPLLTEKLEKLNLSDDETTQMMMKYVRGMMFLQLLEIQDMGHYAGSGVKLGDADTAIFWYQPQESQTWRVIYGDLSVKDVAPENLPQ